MPALFDDETGGHGGDLAEAAGLWNPANGELLDFSSNINPLGPPPGLLKYLRGILPEIVSYPSPQARELRENLADDLNLPREKLLLGNGANELIHLLLLWYRPRRVFVPAPSFSEYERAALLSGALIERYPLPPGKQPDFTALGERLAPGDFLILCNPNNPTGMLYRRADLLPLVEQAAARGTFVMIDESFIPLTGRPEESLRDLCCDQLWVVLSLTKIWSLPGLRLGCAIGPPAAIGELSGRGDPWRVNTLAQKAGLYCIEKKDYLEKTVALVKKERAFLTGRFSAGSRFHVFEGAANYLLVKGLDPDFDAAGYHRHMASRGILIRRADNFYGLDKSFFRVAVRKRSENLRLLQETFNYLEEETRSGLIGSGGGDQR